MKFIGPLRFLFPALVLWATATAVARDVTLVADRQPVATIVLGKEPTRAAQFAAFELQWHIQEMTGATLPIVTDEAKADGVQILVGESAQTKALGLNASDFKSQEYLVRFDRNMIVLMGRDKADPGQVRYDLGGNPADAYHSWPGLWDERGTLNACYDFLEKFCGVRWFNPTDFGMDCPKTPTLAISGHTIRRAPAFRYRDATAVVRNGGDHYDSLVSLWPEITPEFKAWEAAAYPNLHAKFGDDALAKRAQVRLFQLRMHEGGEPARCNHSLYGYYYRFWEKSPGHPELFVEQKPDWFAQGQAGKPPQLCYTSPGLIQQVAQDARDYFDGKKTGAQLGIFWEPALPNPFPVEPMDNSSFCTCDRCQAFLRKANEQSKYFSNGQHSEYFFHFVNAVAKEVRQTHPNQFLITLAYMSHAAPPRSFELEPNVAVAFCFAANRLPYLGDYQHEIELLKQWAKLRQGRPLYLWLYYTFPVEAARGGNFHCFPGFFAHRLGEQFRLFCQLGVRGMFHCGYGQDVEAYVTYKLMDDPTLDVDALLNEYFHRLYGPAGEPLKKMCSLIEQTYCDPANYPKKAGHETMAVAWGNLGTPERMAQLGAWMEQAKTLAATAIQQKRVALFEQSVWAYMRAGRKQYLQTETLRAPTMQSVTVPRLPAAGGDPGKVDWPQAAALANWRTLQGEPTTRKVTGWLGHDGQFFYVQLEERLDPQSLVVAESSSVWAEDEWELFFARQRGEPYRQMGVNSRGVHIDLAHGEPLDKWDSGAVVVSDTSATDRWRVRCAFPLAQLTSAGAKPGDTLYLNILRSTHASAAFALAWVPTFAGYHEPSRFGEMRLAE